MSFIEKLENAWTRSNSLLMVGLDPLPERFPDSLGSQPDAIFRFCRDIADAVAPYVCGFKPQIAHFAAHGAETQLEALCEHLRRQHPDKVLVLDAKRGDIGSTAEHYALEAFERYQADAVTVSPYMGTDSVEPYLRWKDRGIIVLCRTSNSGGADFQELLIGDGNPLYLRVAEVVTRQWNADKQCSLVVGATRPEELARVRALIGDDIPLLVPGIGAQGGDIPKTVQAGINSRGTGMMINSSRAVLYASSDEDWREAAAEAARETRDAINACR